MPTITKASRLFFAILLAAILVLPSALAGEPLILGHGEGRFEVGELLECDNFENLDHWVVQLQEREGFPPAHIWADEGSLDCLLPGRGATVWFKKKLKTRLTITYDVLCPQPDPAIKGYSLPSNGKIIRCSGNAAYGPLLYIHSDSHNSQKIDLTVLPAPHSLGDHPLAAIKGERNSVRFTPASGPDPKVLRPIIVGYPLRFDFLSVDYPKVPAGYEKHFAKYAPDNYRATRNNIVNKTTNPVVLGEHSNDNIIESLGPVEDHGTNND